MPNTMIAAEITPIPGRARSAAKVLQQLGFRILNIGSTISVQSSEDVWKDTFHISFIKKDKQLLSISPSSSIEYAVPNQDAIKIPVSLRELISDIVFVEPPEFF